MPQGRATLAVFLQANDRKVEADEVLRKWVGEDPQDAARHVYVADFYRSAGRPRLAQKHYDRAIALRPKDVQSYLHLAILFEQEGKNDEAIAVYERVVDLVRSDVPIASEAVQRIRLLRAKQTRRGKTRRE
jgi:Tfp pilus assembly protein PilF